MTQPSSSNTVETATVSTLTNDHGVELCAMNYGGTILSLRIPDAEGTLDDVVLGFDAPEKYQTEAYQANCPYFGAVIGRYANRIDDGCFQLDGRTYQLSTNHGSHHLHGGHNGFDKQFWSGGSFVDDRGPGLRYSYTSPGTEEGYPGRLTTTVTYRLTNDNKLIVDYEAESTRPTPVNLTQHTYFNLAGVGNGDVLNHRLTIDADHFTPVDSSLLPTGEVRSVGDTPLDFRSPTRIGVRIEADHPQIQRAQGYDHNFVLHRTSRPPTSLSRAARVAEPHSGRTMAVYTSEPGVQFYSGNSLTGTFTGKGGATYRSHSGLCLETQHFPDSPNHPNFPSTILHPEDVYRSRTVFAFSTLPASDGHAP